jgi:hypothetical protein
LQIGLTIAPLLAIVFYWILHAWIPLFKMLLLMYKSQTPNSLSFEEKLKETIIFLLKFAD